MSTARKKQSRSAQLKKGVKPSVHGMQTRSTQLKRGVKPSVHGMKTRSTRAQPFTIRKLDYSLKTAFKKTDDTLSESINQINESYSEAQRQCVSCQDDYPLSEMIKTKCSHFYCKTCLERMFTAALRDESSFPPRCCQIPIRISRKMLGTTLAKQSREKNVELNDSDPTYCFDPKCSSYLPQKRKRDKNGQCQTCGKHTCRKCKKHAHSGKCEFVCDALLEDLAKQKGWKRCPKCSRLIELWMGCFHIMCICNHHFCYCCLAKWKSCNCLTWQEQRLYAQPN